MRVAVVGSGGYVGVPLCHALESRGDKVLRIDARVYGQPLPPDTIVADHGWTISEAILRRGADAIVWLAAYAHDPAGRIPADEMRRNNTELIYDTLEITTIPVIVTSSLSVFAGNRGGAYPKSKRMLEENLSWRKDFPDRVSILRFGTLFGMAPDAAYRVPTFRSHLLLNNMVYEGLMTGRITYQVDRSRPVLPLDLAVEAIIARLDGGPRGDITNHYLTSGTLEQYAVAVRGALRTHSCFPVLMWNYGEYVADDRDYGWGPFDEIALRGWLHPLIHWTLDNRRLIEIERAKFPKNLYDYVERRK
jgi:nucleoside-diphosphate-sugar epimerase